MICLLLIREQITRKFEWGTKLGPDLGCFNKNLARIEESDGRFDDSDLIILTSEQNMLARKAVAFSGRLHNLLWLFSSVQPLKLLLCT